MDAAALFKAGQLRAAIDAQTAAVKAHPLDPDRRVFLFELLAFAGDWERARKQIDAVQYDDPKRDTATRGYALILEAEAARRSLFADGIAPQFFAPAPDHCILRLRAIQQLRVNDPEGASALLAEAAQATHEVRGTLNDKPFALIRDVDDVFSGVLEVFAHGQYWWVPLESVESLTMNPPRFPRDLLYVPAHLELPDARGDVFLPALYPGSAEHDDEAVRLGRMTDWRELPGGLARGIGRKTFLVDDEAVDLLEWRAYTKAESPTAEVT